MVVDLQVEVKWSTSWRMVFVQHVGNNAAHILAKHAVKNVLDRIWVIPPDCIRDTLLLEQFAFTT